MNGVERNQLTANLEGFSFKEEETSPSVKKTKSEWEKLKQYTQLYQEEAYFLKFLVKKADKENTDETSRFQSLFNELKKNLFGGGPFLPSDVSHIAADYIQIEQRIRNFDLKVFWNHLIQKHPFLNLPNFEEAHQIRTYLESNPEKINQITVLRMEGIYEVWTQWHQKYGESFGFPFFETEKEIHQFLEDPKNMEIIGQVIMREREVILEKTTRLPPEIKYFSNLEKLTFSNRKSLVLPKAVYKFENLKVLNVRHSELHKLSKQVVLLTSLQKMILIGTQFVGLPETMLQMNSLKVKIENKTQMELSASMRLYLEQHAFPSEIN